MVCSFVVFFFTESVVVVLNFCVTIEGLPRFRVNPFESEAGEGTEGVIFKEWGDGVIRMVACDSLDSLLWVARRI